MVVLGRGVPVLHAICAVAGSIFGAARNGACASAGSTRGGAAGNVARRFDDGDASAAERRKPVRRGGRGGGAGAGDLVGKAAGVDFENSGDDGTSSQRIPMGGGAAELRGGGMSGGSSAATNVSICGRITSFIGFILECWNTFEPKRKLGRADGYFTADPPSPWFSVSVASKGLIFCASGLESTLAGISISVASKGVRRGMVPLSEDRPLHAE